MNMKNKFLLLFVLLLPVLAPLSAPAFAQGKDNALAEAIPDVTQLKAESCSANHSNLMESLGLGQMACTISKHINFDSLSKSLGISAFQSGSRTNPLSPSNNVEDFVRYSPNFFTRINQLYMEDTDRLMYGFIYRNLLADSTRLFYMNGKYLRDSRQLQSLTMAHYKQAIANENLGKEAALRCQNAKKTVVKNTGVKNPYPETFKQCGKSGTATLFWYRRKLDGSDDALFTLLDNILKTQDAEYYQQINALKYQ